MSNIHSIVVLPGDGVGPEVTAEAVKVLETISRLSSLKFAFETHLIGGCAIDKFNSALPKATLDACRKSAAVLLGAVGVSCYLHLLINLILKHLGSY